MLERDQSKFPNFSSQGEQQIKLTNSFIFKSKLVSFQQKQSKLRNSSSQGEQQIKLESSFK